MQVERNKLKGFKPFDITIKVETQRDLEVLYLLGGYVTTIDIENIIKLNNRSRISSILGTELSNLLESLYNITKDEVE